MNKERSLKKASKPNYTINTYNYFLNLFHKHKTKKKKPVPIETKKLNDFNSFVKEWEKL